MNYNISAFAFLYIIKLDIREEGMKIPKIEYEVYYSLYNKTLIKLNLTLCKNTKIGLTIPVEINDSIDKYNSSSDYYNDICSKSTSKWGTDITLLDRKNEFINNNITLCEEDCELDSYNYVTKKAKCSCDIKINIPLIEEIKFDKNELFQRFTDLNRIVNLDIIKCYRIVFIKRNIKSNFGFFFMTFILFLYLVSLIIFLFLSFPKLKNDIKNIIFSLKIKKTQKNKRKINLRQNLLQLDVIKISQLNTLYVEYAANMFELNCNKREKETSNTMILDIGTQDDNSQKILNYKDFELNELKFEEALKFDKRSFIQYYLALLKINHLFLFSFFSNNDYNSKIIKIFLFFLFFTNHININALFFNDNTMHKIYIDEGNYNFIYQIPKIIYSSLISIIINFLIKLLSLSQGDIIKLKQEKSKKDLDKKYKKLIKILKIKFILFFVITFIFLLICWYYLSCFCGIYVNTQSHLIKDSLISFATSLIYPLGISLVPGIFRKYALNNEKSCLYKFSKLLQMI